MNSRRPPTPDAATASVVDRCAASIAEQCLAHCLALPLLISSLSLAAPFAENELVHKALVLIAAPATFLAIYADAKIPGRRVFIGAAILGLGLLMAGAFVPALEAYEEPVTVAGSVTLAAAHIWRALDVRAKRRRPVVDAT